MDKWQPNFKKARTFTYLTINKINVVQTMSRFLSTLLLALCLLHSPLVKAQVSQILYTDPEREDGRRTNFEIIGKMNGNFLVFKNNNSKNDICIYDSVMKLQQRVPLTLM